MMSLINVCPSAQHQSSLLSSVPLERVLSPCARCHLGHGSRASARACQVQQLRVLRCSLLGPAAWGGRPALSPLCPGSRPVLADPHKPTTALARAGPSTASTGQAGGCCNDVSHDLHRDGNLWLQGVGRTLLVPGLVPLFQPETAPLFILYPF